MFGQERDVVTAFAQGRQIELDDIETMKQILAKFTGGNRGGDVAIGGGDKTDVHAQFLGAADAGKAAIFQKSQQLGLKGLAHIGDFVQENGAAIGLFDAAVFLFDGAGERAAFVAEELAFQKSFRNGGAIDADVVEVFALA